MNRCVGGICFHAYLNLTLTLMFLTINDQENLILNKRYSFPQSTKIASHENKRIQILIFNRGQSSLQMYKLQINPLLEQ